MELPGAARAQPVGTFPIATPCGPLPTATVPVTVLSAVSMTLTSFEPTSDT